MVLIRIYFLKIQNIKKQKTLKVLISASNLRDENKVNFRFLQFFDDYRPDEILILLMGNADNLKLNTKFPIKKLGYIDDEIQKAKIYNEADALIFPSMDDNCPLTILEAVSCGLPVVCFSNTGMTELISLLKLSELNDKPRILDNMSTPNDYEVLGLPSMCNYYIQVYQSF